MLLEVIPRGICPKKITCNIEAGIVSDIVFTKGCEGNLTALCQLVDGMKIEEIIEKFKGIPCKERGTSCPDQLAIALEDYINRHSTFPQR